MKNQLASFEVRVLVNELKNLEKSRIDQIFDLKGSSKSKNEKAIAIQLATSESKRFLTCLAPAAVFSSKRKPPTIDKPRGFCSFLRRQLGNAKITSITQPGSERIVIINFSSKDKQMSLVIELFSKGNIILLDEKGIILSALEARQWKDRIVKPGFSYVPPPPSADFANLLFEQFSNAILSSEKESLVKALAVNLGLGGVYAEAVLSASSTKKTSDPRTISDHELKTLFSSLQKLLSKKPEPLAILNDQNLIEEVLPFAVGMEDPDNIRKTKSFNTFNEAVEAIALFQLENASTSSRMASYSGKIKELEMTIEQQKAMISNMSKSADHNGRIAELIYENYQEIKTILEDYNKLRKNFTKEELKDYFKNNSLVKNIDEKTGTITLEIE